jgi:hypothetical protein
MLFQPLDTCYGGYAFLVMVWTSFLTNIDLDSLGMLMVPNENFILFGAVGFSLNPDPWGH